MRNAVPDVSVRTVMRRNDHPGWYTTDPACPIPVTFSIPTAIPNPWMIERTIVPYRVYWVIFRRPSSPSFESFSSCGMTTVNSWRMIDALLYGMLPSVKIENRLTAPPENMSISPKRVPDWLFERGGRGRGVIPRVGVETALR